MKSEALPSALDHFESIESKFIGSRLFVFLDYDGTLTPIVNNPEDAQLSSEMRHTLSELAELTTVAIVSGRDRMDIENLIRLENLIYAGSHGFDISGPDGLQLQYSGGEAALPALEEAEESLKSQLSEISGAQVERKKYAIAVHYRNVAEDDAERVIDIATSEAESHDTLKPSPGKKILELKPAIDWDKGKALLWLQDELASGTGDTVPMYIGDDNTDEDALAVIQDEGIGILVGSHGARTYARYGLKNVKEVYDFLRWLNEALRE
ncbi:MAG: trehalose-phosphatase [Candidatus Marinimicrobia bacterium]|nr:trehalose-phosphatase [Candidatus Neomarinimicrobiota bacterium]MCF7828476.1 trehalose-phosphatase [Candidatus Neomarinimicrobiota bacterium]MCF7881966.1 trehalose-phosphatase [Candidatus Neomarinimicrobiota bacterium]